MSHVKATDTHTHTHAQMDKLISYSFLHPWVFSERINPWKQLNHITLCKYPSKSPLVFTTVLAPIPTAPVAQKCALGQINICSYSLQMAGHACIGNETEVHAGENEKIFEHRVINNSSDVAVTFAFRAGGLTAQAF